jgi:hypothetical protein
VGLQRHGSHHSDRYLFVVYIFYGATGGLNAIAKIRALLTPADRTGPHDRIRSEMTEPARDPFGPLGTLLGCVLGILGIAILISNSPRAISGAARGRVNFRLPAPSCRKPANSVGRETPPFRTLHEFEARAARVEIAVAGLFRRRHVSTPGAAIRPNCASACSASPYPRIISCRLALRLERGSPWAPRMLPPARCPDWCNRAGRAWR